MKQLNKLFTDLIEIGVLRNAILRVPTRCLSPRDSPNSAILEMLASVTQRRLEAWFACHVVRYARICASSSGSLLYFGYGYDISSCSPSRVEFGCDVGSYSSSVGSDFFASYGGVFFTSSGVSFSSLGGVFTLSSSSTSSLCSLIIVSSNSSFESFGVAWLER